MYSFSYLEPVCCAMSSSNCCFLTCIQISQKADQMAWYSHLLKNFPQFIVIHTVKGFGIVNKADIDIFLELSCFFSDPVNVGNLIPGSSTFLKASLNIWKFRTWSSLRNDRMISVYFHGKPFNITVVQVCAPTSNAEEAEVERFYEDLQGSS